MDATYSTFALPAYPIWWLRRRRNQWFSAFETRSVDRAAVRFVQYLRFGVMLSSRRSCLPHLSGRLRMLADRTGNEMRQRSRSVVVVGRPDIFEQGLRAQYELSHLDAVLTVICRSVNETGCSSSQTPSRSSKSIELPALDMEALCESAVSN